jgi:L-alanine-DL-glutamate epimerase-like enolase superfamily enzyme
VSDGGLAVERLDVAVYEVPTERPEADGTLQWDSTTVVVVEPRTRSGLSGLGYAVGDVSMASLIKHKLSSEVVGIDVTNTSLAWERMRASIRNLGRPGICSMAIAAVDIALWDTKARALDLPLHQVIGPCRDEVPVYGSGGLTSYSVEELVSQLCGWAAEGIPRVKMKVGKDWGRSWREDLERVAAVRRHLGDDVELFVDANGAYDRTQARQMGERFASEYGVCWFEEPVTSDDSAGLRQLTRTLPLDVAAGEYGYSVEYYRDLLQAETVDVMQADIGRCAGITEWLRVAAECAAHKVPFSGHCQPQLHVHAAAAIPNLRHIEYFHTHARVDHLLFDGALDPVGGCLRPAGDRAGLGVTLKRQDAERFRIA